MKRKNSLLSGKIVTLCFCLMLMVVMTAGVKTSFAAADYVDKDWSFNLSVNEASYQFTKGYAKGTDGYIYLNWQTKVYALNGISVTPYARLSEYGALYAVGTQISSTEYGFRAYNVTSLGQYRIINYVIESGKTHASLGFKSTSGNGTATGKISPDCAGSYPILN